MSLRKLTSRFVETVTTDQDRADYRDSGERGLQLRVSKAGKKTWTFRYRRKSDSAQRRVTIGTFVAKGEGVSLDDARVRARALRSAVDQGADPAGEVQERKHAETFAEIAAEWTTRHAAHNRGARTQADDKSMLERHVFPIIGTMRAAEITKRDIIRMLDAVAAAPDARAGNDTRKPADPKAKRRRRKGRAATRKLTVRPNRAFQLVRAILRWAVGRDMLKVDPTWGMKAPVRKEKPRDRDLSPDEIRQLWTALDRAPVKPRTTKDLPRGTKVLADGEIPFLRPLALTLKLALATGQRIGEVAGIAMAELDLNDTAPVWTVPAERAKNGQANRVPLAPVAVAIVREAMALAAEAARARAAEAARARAAEGETPSDPAPEPKWLFPNPSGDGPINPHAPTKALDRARPAIGIADFRIHDLRRTAATRMAEMGVAPHTISLVLNHVSARRGTITGKVYVQYSYDREKREALNAWGDRLERIVAGADGGNVVAMAR